MPTSRPESTRARSGSRRDDGARLAVLHAADDLLVELGFGGLTVEAIARRAGVAKQTIYRWWPSKVDILLDTLIEDSDKRLHVPPDESSIDGVVGYLHRLARFLSHDPAGRVLLALMGKAQHDAAMARTFRQRYLDPRRVEVRALLLRAMDAGEISPRLDVDVTLDALVGPLIYRAMTGAPLPDALVDSLVAELLTPSGRDDD